MLGLADAIDNTCKTHGTRQLMMEIVYHTVLQSNPQFVTLFGFCLHKMPNTSRGVVEKYFKDSVLPSLVVITEYGVPQSNTSLAALPWKQKLTICRGLAPLLESVKDTLLGPISMLDIQPWHFVKINDTLKIFDLGFYYHGSLPCSAHFNDNQHDFLVGKYPKEPNKCMFDIPCIDGRCSGVHVFINNEIMRDIVLIGMLGKDFYNSIPLENGLLISSAIISRIDKEF